MERPRVIQQNPTCFNIILITVRDIQLMLDAFAAVFEIYQNSKIGRFS